MILLELTCALELYTAELLALFIAYRALWKHIGKSKFKFSARLNCSLTLD